MASILCSRQTIISPLFFPLFLNPSPSSSRFRKSSSHSRPRFRVRSDGRAIKFLKPCGSSNYPNPREKPIIEKIACSNFYNGDEKCVPISSKLETEEKVSALKVHRKSLSLNRVAESGFVGVGCVKKNNVVKDALKRVALVLFFVAVGLRPVQSFQVCAFAATTVVDVDDREPGLRDHEYSHYTRELLEKVSGLVRSVEAARKGSGDLKDVEAALRIVKLKNEELEEKIMDGLHTELKELDMEKEELQKRAYEILKVALKEKREHGKLFRKVISGNAEQGLKERMMSLGESIARMVEDYNAILQRVGEFEDQILRKKTMALSIGVREISFIERESEQLVNELRKEMRQMGSNRMPKSSLTKSARSDIKKELETAQRRYWEQIILPGVVETEELGVLFDQNYMDFAKRIKNSLEESRELQRNLEAHIRKKMERFGDEKLFVVSTPPHEVVKGFPEVELKWMFGNKEVVVPDAVSLDMFHGWNRWREETKADLKRNLLENNDIGRQYAAKRQERILLDRDRVVSKTWYNEERSRWEMDPIAIPYAASKKLIKRARIRHDWAAMYVVLKGDEKEYYIDIKEYEMLFEDFGGFDALYLKMIACGIPTAVQFMWIPFSELDIQQQFLLAMRLSHLCLNGLWKTKVVSHAKEWAFENIKNINDDLMMMIVFPIIEFIIPFPLRIHLGMAWPEETYQSVGSTWYLKWQSEAEMSFRSRKSDNFLWYLWFLIRSFLYGYILFRVTRFMRRKVSKLLGYEPLHREPNLQKLQRLKFYFNYKMRKVQSLRKAGLDPIRAAFDQMKRVKNPPIRLEDFASIDSIREEINEVVAFLQNPSTFQEVGARAPRGILIVGETGTGKTSLALAIAAKARVPLVEVKAQQLEAGLWVGQSASNVRELFQTARDLAPVIIFIEDFDLFAGVRGKFIHTGKQDHEAFINQLLVELDGFEKQNGVVLMATTRNLKKIDEALQRPGRMDRIFHLQRPTQTEREKILMISAKETMDDELINFVDWRKVAEKTALLRPIELKFVPVALECSAFRSKFLDKDELMNYCSWFATFSHLVPDWVRKTQLGKKMSKMLVNHLGLTLAREDLQNVVELMEPYGQISNGIELVNPPLDWTREVKLPHSVWAAGRGLVAVLLPNFDIVDNIWLEPLSWQGIGCTKITKARNQGSINGNVESRSYLEKKLVFCFGSHVASQLLLPFGEENFLSSSELKQAQEIATRMVIQYGWDPHGNPSVYYHGSAATALSMGNDLEFEIAAKIEKVYHLAYDRAKEMLQKNLLVLQKIVDELLEFEILTEKDLQRLVKENGGIREKEPFHLSEDYYEEQTLSSSFLDGVNSSPTALLGAPNNKST